MRIMEEYRKQRNVKYVGKFNIKTLNTQTDGKFSVYESRGYLNWFTKVLDIFFSFYQQNLCFPSDIILKKQALIKRL